MTPVNPVPLVADPTGDNPARLKEITDRVAAMAKDTPVVMLPVRLETRFVRVPAPVAVPVTLADLAGHLTDAARPLRDIARSDLATARQPTAKKQQAFKRKVENPMCDLVAARLGVADAALGAADLVLRQELDGDPRPVTRAIAAVRSGLTGAGAAIADARSDWQRARLQEALDGVVAHAAATLGQAESRALPAADLRRRLAGRPAAPAGREIPAVLVARGAETYEAVLAGVDTLAADPAAAGELAARATTIPLLPADLRDDLARKIDAAAVIGADVARLRDVVAAIPVNGGGLTAAPPTQLVNQLLVRIYPDDIAVDTHEPALTQAELDAGKAYWTQRGLAGDHEADQRAAWRALCAGRGSRRAAWVAVRTQPRKPPNQAGPDRTKEILAALQAFEKRVLEVSEAAPGTRTDALLRAATTLDETLAARRVVSPAGRDRIADRWASLRAALTTLRLDAGRLADPAARTLASLIDRIDRRIARLPVATPRVPVTPDVGTLKDGAWTRAARSGVLPDRFAVVVVAGGRVVHAVAGRPVPGDLKLSIDPSPDDPAAEAFTLDADGDLVVGASIRWMVDYEEALAKGMAITVPITPQEALAGFDAVYVVGLAPGDADDGADRITALLDNHHYAESGLALVPVGTPTNNTERAAAGFRSVDDPDAAFAVEAGPPLVDATQPLDAAAGDGLRLARALGVAPEVLAHVAGADRRDAAEAQTATAALYPATVGAWLFDQAAGLISRDARGRLRDFATGHVAARGLLPAFRVGRQPYGVLPAVAHTAYAPDPAEAGVPLAQRPAQGIFDTHLADVLALAAQDWSAIRAERVSTATDPDIADPRAHFLELLGLEAVSAGSAYRFAVNVAGRHSAASLDASLEFGLPSTNPAAPATGARFGPFALLERFAPVLASAFDVDPDLALVDRGQVADPWADVYSLIVEARAYELRHLDRAHPVTGPVTGQDPPGDVAAILAARPADLAHASWSRDRMSLLALLGRHARLAALREAAIEVLVRESLVSDAQMARAGSSSNFVVPSLLSPETLTGWTYLFTSLGVLGTWQGIGMGSALTTYLGNGALAMADLLAGPPATGLAGFAGGVHADVVADLDAQAAGLTELASLPQERVAPLVLEHLDLAGHRLDAWITGLAHRRLVAMRADKPVGVYVGAYGWVEDLRPDPGHPLATDVPDALRDPGRPILSDPANQGFLHAPSVNHAVTAAILRGGYVSQREEGDVDNRMAVNLSSRRTRLATGLIDGVRAGNTLGALLGYRLERFLHEYHATAGVTIDAVIGPLRQAFPSAAGVDAGLSPDAAARQVCDGLAIADAVARWITANAADRSAGRTVYDVLADGGHFTGHPWGLGAAIPGVGDPTHLDGVVRAIDHVADALDALGDVVVAEGVHQIVMGNHDRAAAVLTALGEGRAPPAPEVVATPRTGTTVTHRLLMPMPAAAAAPGGWAAIPMTARASTEPSVNGWAATVLGAPGDIRIRVVEEGPGGGAVGEVTVADLGLQALDLVAILGPGLETGAGELAARALDAMRPADLDDDAPPVPRRAEVARRAARWGDEVRTLAEIAPLVEAIAALLGGARPADAHDFVLAEGPQGGGDSGVDLADLEVRVAAARDALQGAAVNLLRLLAGDATLQAADLPADGRAFIAAQDPVPDPPYWSTRDDWRDALIAAAAFGIPAAVPPGMYRDRVQVRRALRAAAETAFVEAIVRLRAAAPGLSAATPTASGLVASATAIFGAGFPILPLAVVRNRPELTAALAAPAAGAEEIDGWLAGLAPVREGCGDLANMLVLGDAHGWTPPALAMAQLPHADGEAWLGHAAPAAGQGGRLSLAIADAGSLPADGVAGPALLIDQWTELVPSATETTGVAINYDQPDSTPPQCVLVCVPPTKVGAWRLEELVQTLADTLDLARSRAVELEHLQQHPIYGQLLPAVVGEVIPDAVATPQAGDDRVVLDFGRNR